MKQKQVYRRYYVEMAASFALYTVLLTCSIRFGRPLTGGALRTAVLFSPMLGFLGAIWAIARHLAGIDEYQRKSMLEAWALAGALTAAITFSYGFLETAGYPKISMFSVWMIMCTCMVLVCCARALLRR